MKWSYKAETGFGTREVNGFTPNHPHVPEQSRSEPLFTNIMEILTDNEKLDLQKENDRLVLCQQIVRFVEKNV